MKNYETVASRDLENEELSNSDNNIEPDNMAKKKQYVAVKGYTKKVGKKKVRVRPHLRKAK